LEAREALDKGAVDLVTFTSSSTVTHFAALLGERAKDVAARAPAAVIGPITAQTALEAGFRMAAEASVHTVDGLVAAIVNSCQPSAVSGKL
jgi:uroporphyrinogen III methyltransferase/synthase